MVSPPTSRNNLTWVFGGKPQTRGMNAVVSECQRLRAVSESGDLGQSAPKSYASALSKLWVWGADFEAQMAAWRLNVSWGGTSISLSRLRHKKKSVPPPSIFLALIGERIYDLDMPSLSRYLFHGLIRSSKLHSYYKRMLFFRPLKKWTKGPINPQASIKWSSYMPLPT